MKRLIAGKLGFTAEEMKILVGRSPHALRHTSDTRSQRDYRPMSPNAFEDTLPRRPQRFTYERRGNGCCGARIFFKEHK